MPKGSAAEARKQSIVLAATEVFLRFGLARTTMNDLARAAGLTRPTLYLSFGDKQQVFDAVIDRMVSDKLSEIRAGMQRRKSLEAKLLFACINWSSGSYAMLKIYPGAVELFDYRQPAVQAAYSRFTDLLAEVLDIPLRRSGFRISAREAARTIALATRGLRELASSEDELRRVIEFQVKLVATAIDPAVIATGRRYSKQQPKTRR